ncbi:sigma-70 family RNA polymerase sigma factor [Parabacteroides sp. PF5-9]|uniref:RNA polymerase sigma factor n=1 Tax=Parabacteroides sp. PF5-9 TaxID=1742404 RepID=UPI0024770EDF|nr:sigma-70 family RNA polymerase sigma factor [Parabacteroides sp. PF5-9]MDH6359160.1 RNA polymerase sigma factor (sigma-70 family) [Parabacteroides sp. PF5-9]
MVADKETFLQLLEENKGIIFSICRSYCTEKEDIDDLAQEIIYNLWKAFTNYTPTSCKFTTWMYRVALNVAISFYRKEIRSLQFNAFSEDLIVYDDDFERSTESDQRLNLLYQFIHGLNEIDKSIMLLYLDDKSYKEIADIVGITETNVATKINRIKKKMKSKF